MIYFILLIPIITCCILMWKFRKETTTWEYVLVIVPSIALYFLFKGICIAATSSDTEYLGNYVTSTIYYEEWDEMVLVTKTRQVPCGTDKKGNTIYRTETYTEWERRYHPEEYCYTVKGSTHKYYIKKSEFDIINAKLNVTPLFKDMHRNYHRIDGDAYIRYYNGKPDNCYTITNTHLYINKVAVADHSIFNLKKLNDDEIKDNGLLDYPNIEHLDQNPVIGLPVPKNQEDAIRFINGYYGAKHQIRIFVLIFNNPDINIADLQRSYWEGGNKNELNICLGVKNNKVLWCQPFSWSDEPLLEAQTKQYFLEHDSLDLDAYAKYITPRLKNWHRKEFKDFNYLQIQLVPWQIWMIVILITLYNIAISYYVITNEFTNYKTNNYKKINGSNRIFQRFNRNGYNRW